MDTNGLSWTCDGELQNCVSGGAPFTGGFDSHAPSPFKAHISFVRSLLVSETISRSLCATPTRQFSELQTARRQISSPRGGTDTGCAVGGRELTGRANEAR